MKPNGIPETNEEADQLRAYIPTETLVHIAKIRDEEVVECENARSTYEAAKAKCKAIKERMRNDRSALKQPRGLRERISVVPCSPAQTGPATRHGVPLP